MGHRREIARDQIRIVRFIAPLPKLIPFHGSAATFSGYQKCQESAATRKDRRINNCRSRSRQTSDLNSGEFSDIRQLFLRRS